MPWKPRYSEAEARDAIDKSRTWTQALNKLGLKGWGKNVQTLRRWADRWQIEHGHLPEPKPRNATAIRYGEAEARDAIAKARSWSEALRRLGYCPSGGNPRTLKRRAKEWGISVDHFDPYARHREARRKLDLSEILVDGSRYSRSHLKERLYTEGLKERRCELCGQGELWRGRRMSLILDHVNGVRDDNRIENLRIVCANCAATLDTHCSRNPNGVNIRAVEPRKCLHCSSEFRPKYATHRYCSVECGRRWDRRGGTIPGARKVERPPHHQLLREVEERGYSAVGRKHGVSDNAVRKWLRAYEREAAVAHGEDAEVIEIPTRTWPSRKRAA